MMEKLDVYHDFIYTEIGYWLIKASDDKLLELGYTLHIPDKQKKPNKITQKTFQQLEEYFQKERKTFDLPLHTETYSPFYQKVWSEVSSINYARTSSYLQIAKKLNNPKAVRAVGTANGKNPFPIIIPCHRVIGSDGKLTGYAFGLEVKKWLLQHEGYLQAQLTLY